MSILHHLTVSATQPLPPRLHMLPILPSLIHPEHTARKQHQRNQIPESQRLGLKDVLQPREINNQDLSTQAQGDGPIEELIAKQFDFSSENGFGFGTAVESVEHIEEHETSERHSGITFRDFAVGKHFVGINGHCAEHNYRCRCEDAGDERPG